LRARPSALAHLPVVDYLCYVAEMAQARLLVVDDEPYSADQVVRLLGKGGIAIESVRRGAEAIRSGVAAEGPGHPFDVILVDYHVPGGAGVEVLRELGERGIDSRIIFMSGQDPSDAAVEAMRLGAFDFIAKPLNRAELSLRIERALRDRRAAALTATFGESMVRRPRKSDVIIGGGTWVKDLYERISMVAPTDVTVAISGESGTGKE